MGKMYTIGSDMELFAKTPNGDHVPLCGLIGGSKEEPKQIKGLGKGFMVQEDNVALEFNIPPAQSRDEFITYFAVMREKVTDILKGLKLQPSKEASVSFNKKQLTHPQALIFGCEPDYNAWSAKENRKPVTEDKTLRTAGGHIHVGANVDMLRGVKNMDLFIGVPSLLLDTSPSSVARRKLYGKAGAMRPKPYGWEYRVASNFWMWEDYLVGWIFDQTNMACRFDLDFSKKEGQRIEDCINTNNLAEAELLCQKYGIVSPTLPIKIEEVPF